MIRKGYFDCIWRELEDIKFEVDMPKGGQQAPEFFPVIFKIGGQHLLE